MNCAAAIELTLSHLIASLTGTHPAPVTARSFRTSHHPISAVRLIGGSHMPLSREVSLIHHGILFLDKLVDSAAMSLKCCASRSRTVSQADNLAGISDLTALAAQALRVQAVTVELIPHRQETG